MTDMTLTIIMEMKNTDWSGSFLCLFWICGLVNSFN